jgi:hypothetical protein
MEGWPIQVFHDEVGHTRFFARTVNDDNIRVPQPRHDSGFLLKALAEGFIVHKCRQQDLDRDDPI